MNGIAEIIDKLFYSEQKYTIGLIFIFANIASFFLNMRKLNINDNVSFFILLIFVFFGRKII
jgi:hypothetical protein